MLTTSEAGLRIIKQWEGVRLRPYRCPAGVWTVGYGHVIYPKQARLTTALRLAYPLAPEDDRLWSLDEVTALLAVDIRTYERAVHRLCPPVSDRQGAFDALVSFVYNLGAGTLQHSTLRQRILQGNFDAAAREFGRYVYSKGKKLNGLVYRRAAEAALFLSTSVTSPEAA